MTLPSGFTPTAFQAGHAIGLATFGGLVQAFSGSVDPRLLLDAGITVNRYSDELQLLASAAALHGIEDS